MTPKQQKYLEERISSIANSKSYQRGTTMPATKEPAKITTARQLVRDYDQTVQAKRTERQLKISQAKVALLDSIFFSDVEEVLAKLKAFEEQEF